MKKINFIAPAIMAIFFCLCASMLWAQDPVVVDAKHYKVVAENNEVRVLRIKYGPGEKSVMHFHPEGVAIYMTNSAGEFTMPDGKVIKSGGKAGEVILAPAGKHQPHNGDKPLEVIQVELKGGNPVRWTTTAPEVDVTKALVKDYEDGNWTKWMTHYSDTAKIFHNSVEGITSAALQDAFKGTLQKLSSYHFMDNDRFFERIIDNDGATWVYFWATWEAKVTATGKTITIPVHLALKFVDNKIVREYGYYDRSQLVNL